jgi:hypothetical protein
MEPPDSPRVELTPEHRALLARKGELLYAKSCGTKGRGGCAEGFAIHQLRIGNEAVVRDFLRFLEGRLAQLRCDDPERLREMTERLIAGICTHLER